MATPFRLTLVLAGLCAAPLAAQQVHVVATTGGDFGRVQDAINAAASGDTILIRPGTYLDFFANVIDGKSLVILGDGSPAPTTEPFLVRNLASDQQVLLRGLELGPSLTGLGAPALYAHDNAGLVWVEDCTLQGDNGVKSFGGLPSSDGAPGLSAEHCAGVSVIRSVLAGGRGAITSQAPFGVFDPSFGGPALSVLGSDVALHGCVGLGGDGGYDPADVALEDGLTGGAGARIDGGSVVLSDVLLQGGDGGSGCDAAVPGACDGGDGLVLVNGSTVFHQEGTFHGGAGGALSGGGFGLPGSDRVTEAGSQQFAWDGGARALEMTSPVRELQFGTIRYEGEQGDTFGLFLSVPQGHVPLLGKQGVFSLGFPLLGPVLVWTVTAPDGVFEVPFEAWDMTSSGLETVTVYGQCFAKNGGLTRLSGPGALTIVADQF